MLGAMADVSYNVQVLFNFITALNPASPTFSESNQQDVRKRPAGGVQKPSKVTFCAAMYHGMCTMNATTLQDAGASSKAADVTLTMKPLRPH